MICPKCKIDRDPKLFAGGCRRCKLCKIERFKSYMASYEPKPVTCRGKPVLKLTEQERKDRNAEYMRRSRAKAKKQKEIELSQKQGSI